MSKGRPVASVVQMILIILTAFGIVGVLTWIALFADKW